MNRTGSWRFAQSTEQVLHVLLFTRAAAGLDSPTPPPPLHNGPSYVDLDLPRAERSELEQIWHSWWDGQVARSAMLHGAHRVQEGTSTPEWAADYMKTRPPTAALSGSPWRRSLGERLLEAPPEYEGLEQALQPTARSVWPAAKAWTSHNARNKPPEDTEMPDPLIRSVANQLIAELTVDPIRMNAVLFPLAVEGPWWQLWAPGVMLCSFDCVHVTDIAEEIVRTTFESSLSD